MTRAQGISSIITGYMIEHKGEDVPYSDIFRDLAPELAAARSITNMEAESVLRNNVSSMKSRGALEGGRSFARYPADSSTSLAEPVQSPRPPRSYGFDTSTDSYWKPLDRNPVAQNVALLIGTYPPINGALKEYFGPKPEWTEQSKLHAVQVAAEVVTGAQRTRSSVPDYVFQGLIKLMEFDHGRYMKKFAEAVEEGGLNYLNVLEEISDSGDGAIPRIIHSPSGFRRRR